MAGSGKLCTAPRPWERISESRKSYGGLKAKDHDDMLKKIKIRYELKEAIRRMKDGKN